MRRVARREPAQALVWVAVMLPLFLSVIGLAFDGGMLFNARRSLQSVADGAARIGAMQVDQTAVRAGGAVVLDPIMAREAASAYLARQRPGLNGTVAADPQQVVVQVRRDIPTGFIQLVGVETIPVDAVATGRPCSGIDRGSC